MKVIPEPEVKDRLRAAGVPVPAVSPSRGPVVLKAFGEGIVHKTDVGAVRLGLDPSELDDAKAEMTATLAKHGLAPAGFLVEEQVPPGIELLVGVTRTPFGLAVAVGLGGTLAEVLDDVALALAPVDLDRAHRLLRSFRAAAVLDGVRGQPPLDRDALARLVVAVSEAAEREGPALQGLECNPVIARPDGAVAVDARLILRSGGENGTPAPRFLHQLDVEALLSPRSIAVVGASTSKAGFGNRALAAYRAFGWTDGLWAVHPTAAEIDGVPAVPSVADVPGGVDYALVAVPAATCADVVRSMTGHVKVAHVVSGGFAEVGSDGAALQDDLAAAAQEAGVRVLGPNCIGLYAPAGRQTFQLDVPAEAGGVTIVSQSGGLAGDMVRAGGARGLRFSAVVTAGNGADVSIAELVERLADRPETNVLGLYVESTDGADRIVDVLCRARGRVPAAVLVGGLSRQGRRAAASHTGALTGERRLWEAVADDTGATVVDDLDRFLGVLVHLQHFRDHAAGGDDGTVVIGVGGGATVLATDACDAAGLDVRPLSGALVESLRGLGYGAGTSVANPIEIGIGPAAPDDVFARILDPLLGHTPFDDVLLHVNVQAYYGYGPDGAAPLLRQLAVLEPTRWPGTRVTLVLRNLDTAPCDERDAVAAAAPVPAYRSLAEAASAIAATKRFRRFRKEQP